LKAVALEVDGNLSVILRDKPMHDIRSPES